MSVTRAKFFQVLVGDSNAIDALKAKDPKGKEPEANGPEVKDSDNQDQVPNTVISDEEDKALVKDAQPWGSNTKPIRLLFEHYKEKGVVVDMDHEDKPQSEYVDFSVANAFLDGTSVFSQIRLLSRERPWFKLVHVLLQPLQKCFKKRIIHPSPIYTISSLIKTPINHFF